MQANLPQDSPLIAKKENSESVVTANDLKNVKATSLVIFKDDYDTKKEVN
tara:strand:- start:129098 stop:129247 length:150 start_codon:yes stop_codon:yes gene_type:complete